ncbi:MAG: hypothetical protein ACFCVK_13440 [Acidimicrobiales bacterium]
MRATTGVARALAVMGTTLVLALGAFGGPAAADDKVEVPIATAYNAGEPGSVHQLGSAPVPADLTGRTCTVNITVTNQESVHAGNRVIVSSDGSQVALAGVEDTAGGVTTSVGELVMGSTIDVSVELGSDGLSSLGSNLTVTCEALPVAPPAKPVVQTPTYTG